MRILAVGGETPAESSGWEDLMLKRDVYEFASPAVR
jgi:hypothetical protein